MTPSDKKPSLSIVPTSNASKETSTRSSTRASDSSTSKTPPRQKLGVQTTLLQHCFMIFSNFRQSVSVMNEVKWLEQSIVTPSNDSNYTLSLNQSLVISSHLETLGKKLVFLKQRLM